MGILRTHPRGLRNALSGNRAEAQKSIGQLKELSAHAYVTPFNFARIYAGLGDKDQVLA